MEVTFVRHMLVDWKKRMYMSVQESIVTLINEHTAELWKTEAGRKWLNAGDNAPPDSAPPTIDVSELQEPALGGLEVDGISQEELIAFEEENIDELTSGWMKEWCEHGDDFA